MNSHNFLHDPRKPIEKTHKQRCRKRQIFEFVLRCAHAAILSVVVSCVPGPITAGGTRAEPELVLRSSKLRIFIE